MVIEPGNSLNSHNASTAKTRQQQPTKLESDTTQVTSSDASTDSVSLSSQSRSIAKLEANLAKSSDVDMDKVASLKAEINEGRYQVDTESLAGKVFQDESILG